MLTSIFSLFADEETAEAKGKRVAGEVA